METDTLELPLALVEAIALGQLALGVKGCPQNISTEARAVWYLGRLVREHLADESRLWDEDDRRALKEAAIAMKATERRFS